MQPAFCRIYTRKKCTFHAFSFPVNIFPRPSRNIRSTPRSIPDYRKSLVNFDHKNLVRMHNKRQSTWILPLNMLFSNSNWIYKKKITMKIGVGQIVSVTFQDAQSKFIVTGKPQKQGPLKIYWFLACYLIHLSNGASFVMKMKKAHLSMRYLPSMMRIKFVQKGFGLLESFDVGNVRRNSG